MRAVCAVRADREARPAGSVSPSEVVWKYRLILVMTACV